MVGYTACEQAVLEKFRSVFADKLNEERCQSSNIDRVFNAMLAEGALYGCVLDFGGGSLRTRAPFTTQIWGWNILGFFLIRYIGDQDVLDQQVREVIDTLATMFKDDPRAGGASLSRLTEISTPEPETINDTPLYWLPFGVEVLDK